MCFQVLALVSVTVSLKIEALQITLKSTGEFTCHKFQNFVLAIKRQPLHQQRRWYAWYVYYIVRAKTLFCHLLHIPHIPDII